VGCSNSRAYRKTLTSNAQVTHAERPKISKHGFDLRKLEKEQFDPKVNKRKI
jgi:hypothetical protein